MLAIPVEDSRANDDLYECRYQKSPEYNGSDRGEHLLSSISGSEY